MQRTSPSHVAIIMDGNGRWATSRRLPRSAGHRAGATAVRRVVEAARAERITALTLYAFSSDNWRRPAEEVDTLMRLFARYLQSEIPRLVENEVRLEIIGRRDRLPALLRSAILNAERETRQSTQLHLRIAVDYSSREAISSGAVLPDVDLLIRTGGEQRLSDFLLWESAYAELYFTSVMWPDFAANDLRSAIDAFESRERRFGGLPAQAS
jgi:undecaprenyl diphosphate synthase